MASLDRGRLVGLRRRVRKPNAPSPGLSTGLLSFEKGAWDDISTIGRGEECRLPFTDSIRAQNDGARYVPWSDTWTAVATGTMSGRNYHAAVWTGREMIVWGGYDGGDPLNTGGVYDPGTDTWTATSTGIPRRSIRSRRPRSTESSSKR